MNNEKYDEIVDKVLDLTLGGHELDDQARGLSCGCPTSLKRMASTYASPRQTRGF
jgi:hypothetical protein